MGQNVTPQSKARIAGATGLSIRTVDKYYSGIPVNESTRRLIERAAFELDLPGGQAARTKAVPRG